MSLNANDEMLAGNADADASYPDAIFLIQVMLIVMLIYVS